MRIEGSQGRPEREFNGPVVGWQEQYRTGLAQLGSDFRRCRLGRASGAPGVEDRRDFRDLIFTHGCESLYGDPIYGGNRDGAAGRPSTSPATCNPEAGPMTR